jgi:hypothetical protein
MSDASKIAAAFASALLLAWLTWVSVSLSTIKTDVALLRYKVFGVAIARPPSDGPSLYSPSEVKPGPYLAIPLLPVPHFTTPKEKP